MLALTGPYGWDSFNRVHITLERIDRCFNEHELELTLLEYSCYPPAIPRIFKLLREVGRYDCAVQEGWFRSGHIHCAKELAKSGVKLVIQDWYQHNERVQIP